MRNNFRRYCIAISLLALVGTGALPAQADTVFVDGVNAHVEYTYDDNGALTKDLNRGITNIEYDNLGNPKKITFTDNRSIEYSYSSDGTKLRTIHKKPRVKNRLGGGIINWSRDTTEYVGNLILKNRHPDMLQFDGGYASFSHDTIDGLHYYIQDYQGNNRMVVNKDGTIEQITHYYPYGGVIGDISTNESLQKYKFEGKELDRSFGLDNYDIHARLDGRENKISVSRFSRQDGKGQHGNHPNYNKQILDRISNMTEEQGGPSLAKQFRNLVEKIRNIIKENPKTKINDIEFKSTNTTPIIK